MTSTKSDALVLFSDLHLHDDLRFDDCIKSVKFVNQVCQSIERAGLHPVSAFLGDLAEGHVVRGRRTYSAKVMTASMNLMRMLRSSHFVDGNHDVDLVSSNSIIDVATYKNNLVTGEFSRKCSQFVTTQNKTFNLLKLHYNKPDGTKKSLESWGDLLRTDYGESTLAKNWHNPDRKRILLGHFGLAGADIGNGVDWVGGISVSDIPIKELDLDLIVLGHYHAPQTLEVTDCDLKIMYCGSMVPMGYELQDTPEPRGPIIVKVNSHGGLEVKRVKYVSKFRGRKVKSNNGTGKVVEAFVEDRVDRLTKLETPQRMVLDYLNENGFECSKLTEDVVDESFEGTEDAEKWEK